MADGRDRIAWDHPASIPAVDLSERPAITFADVGGMDQVKDEIRIKVIHPLGHPELYRAYGKAIGGGILMYGPPGCGKTHLARATAGEVGAGFVAVGIDQVLDMWIGSSERNLHGVFERARRSRPCVLFFDEVDARCQPRGPASQRRPPPDQPVPGRTGWRAACQRRRARPGCHQRTLVPGLGVPSARPL